MKYFFDNCISWRLVAALKALEVDAIALREELDEATQDLDLFEKLGGRDVVFVSVDLKQTTKKAEARILRSLNITALYFAPFWTKMKRWDQAAWLFRRWPQVDGYAKGAARGTVAEVKQNGRSLVIPK